MASVSPLIPPLTLPLHCTGSNQGRTIKRGTVEVLFPHSLPDGGMYLWTRTHLVSLLSGFYYHLHLLIVLLHSFLPLRDRAEEKKFKVFFLVVLLCTYIY